MIGTNQYYSNHHHASILTSVNHVGQIEVAVTQASGNYLSKLPTRAIYTLCNYTDQGINLKRQLIKATIKSLW